MIGQFCEMSSYRNLCYLCVKKGKKKKESGRIHLLFERLEHKTFHLFRKTKRVALSVRNVFLIPFKKISSVLTFALLCA